MANKTIKIFYDFEFLEDHKHVDQISMGAVREDGQELYIVFNDFDTLAVARQPWLMANVMPFIGHDEYTSHITGFGTPVKDLRITDPAAMSKAEAREAIMRFTFGITPEWWAWYGAYDHVALCGIFGRMIDLPAHWPMMTMDIKQLHKEKGYPAMPKQPANLHNALDDARMNVVRYDYLMNYSE